MSVYTSLRLEFYVNGFYEIEEIQRAVAMMRRTVTVSNPPFQIPERGTNLCMEIYESRVVIYTNLAKAKPERFVEFAEYLRQFVGSACNYSELGVYGMLTNECDRAPVLFTKDFGAVELSKVIDWEKFENIYGDRLK